MNSPPTRSVSRKNPLAGWPGASSSLTYEPVTLSRDPKGHATRNEL
ncbi:MAG: hypothetical protein JWP76_2506 [Dactylosporangium sp.]|nr:hypothetical protein [Dactylosporangium sp.]